MVEIALTGLPLDHPHSGSAVYTRELLRRLPAEAPDIAFHLYNRHSRFYPHGIAAHTLVSPLRRFNRGSGFGARLDKLGWEWVALPLATRVGGHSLLHYTYFAAPLYAPCPVIVTVHDLIPLLMPGHHRTRQSQLYSRAMAHTVTRCALIITVSEYSRSDILRILKVPEDRVCVTYEAVDERFFSPDTLADNASLARYDLPPQFLLYIGSAERRKNLCLLVRAFAAVASTMRKRQAHLVLVTTFPRPDPLFPDVPALIRELGVEDIVRIIPSVEEIDKSTLYRSALAFCFPSIYEGFGLPPLEAMASGVPVLAANCTSVPEITGDAAWLLPPHDIDAWADAMTEVTESSQLRGRMSANGKARAAFFSWKKTADQTIAAYRRVLGE